MAASRTAQYVALYRALETDERRRPPLFRDPYALGFLPRSLALAIRAARAPAVRGLLERYADRRSPGARTSAIARTAYIDDAVRAAVRGGLDRRSRAPGGGGADGSAGGAGDLPRGIDQVVILGAGFDCRAHRMPELAGAAVYEVDRAETQAVKRARLPERAGLRYVAVDFLRDELGASLASVGWDPGRRTLFLWEGVTNYLTEAAVARTLAWIGTTAPGSQVVFTYVHAGLLDGSVAFDGGAFMMENVRRLGEPWTFGLDPGAVAAFVARCGLRLRDDLGADDYRLRYLGAALPGYRFYRVACADVATRDPAS